MYLSIYTSVYVPIDMLSIALFVVLLRRKWGNGRPLLFPADSLPRQLLCHYGFL